MSNSLISQLLLDLALAEVRNIFSEALIQPK
jgi:hypothetical protein